jgi:hypothetical protein
MIVGVELGEVQEVQLHEMAGAVERHALEMEVAVQHALEKGAQAREQRILATMMSTSPLLLAEVWEWEHYKRAWWVQCT